MQLPSNIIFSVTFEPKSVRISLWIRSIFYNWYKHLYRSIYVSDRYPWIQTCFCALLLWNIIWGQWCVRILRRIFLDLMFFRILLCANCNFCITFTKRWIKRTKNKKDHRALNSYAIFDIATFDLQTYRWKLENCGIVFLWYGNVLNRNVKFRPGRAFYGARTKSARLMPGSGRWS